MTTITWIAVFFVFAGAMHFICPRRYLEIMPPWIPKPEFWVYFTGVGEIVGGAGILIEQTRWLSGWGLIALLIGVLPANIQMLLRERWRGSRWKIMALILRLPLQFLLIRWVYCGAGLGQLQ